MSDTSYTNDTSYDEFRAGYVEAVLWCGTYDIDTSAEDHGGFGDYRDAANLITPATLGTIDEDCRGFFDDEQTSTMLGYLVTNYGAAWDSLGVDFYLTRNRHGCGFWDRGYDIVGDALSDESHTYGEWSMFYDGESHTIAENDQ